MHRRDTPIGVNTGGHGGRAQRFLRENNMGCRRVLRDEGQYGRDLCEDALGPLQ